MSDLTIAVVGNPNCGKTTLFNALTGASQQVGNWSGVTVERKSGSYSDAEGRVTVVDLPGVYSLGTMPGADSLDEAIGRDFILSGEADVVVDIVDATNLERNFYLAAQLIEMRKPMVLAINMMDAAVNKGIEIDTDILSRRLGVPVVGLVARRGDGLADLKQAVRRAKRENTIPKVEVAYCPEVEGALEELLPRIGDIAKDSGIEPRWLAVKLLEGDGLARRICGPVGASIAASLGSEIRSATDEDPDTLIADGRYRFAAELVGTAVRQAGEMGRSLSDAIDRVALHRWLGPPIFLGVMYLLFMATINLGGAFIDFFDQAAGAVFVEGFGLLLAGMNAPDWLRVLLADGLGGGIQVVATFIPIIGILYLFLSFIEDSGYMARAAFLMDRLMRTVGLPGKAFVPLVIGFGCNVPAVMATRSMEKARDRTISVMMTPFMSCGARLAVYALFAAAFFPSGGQNVVFALYLIGILAAILTGLALKSTLLKGDTQPFVMEMPSYHLPRPQSLLIHTWTRLKSFMIGAGRIIVMVIVVMSFLNSLGTDGSFGNEDSEDSVLSTIGKGMVPVFAPMGIREDNWPATVGIFTGIFAKEAVVGTLDALYSGLAGEVMGEADEAPFDLTEKLSDALATIPENLAGLKDLLADPLGLGVAGLEAEEMQGAFGAMAARFDGGLGAFAYLLFILLYIPCVATLGAIYRELGGGWTVFSALWTTGVAYAAAVGFYQAATWLRHPGASTIWLTAIATALLLTWIGLKYLARRNEVA